MRESRSVMRRSIGKLASRYAGRCATAAEGNRASAAMVAVHRIETKRIRSGHTGRPPTGTRGDGGVYNGVERGFWHATTIEQQRMVRAPAHGKVVEPGIAVGDAPE